MVVTALALAYASHYTSHYSSGNGTVMPNTHAVHGYWGDYGYWG